MIIPYTRFLSFLVNGLDKTYRTNLYRVKDDLEFRLEEYVLSQVHLAIICHLLKRDLYLFCRVYRFFEEKRAILKSEMITVLGWFYRDMSGFFRNVAGCSHLSGVSLKVTVPENILISLGIEAENISFEQEKQEVLLALKQGRGKYEQYIKLIYSEVKELDSLFETTEQENRYVMSVILLHFSEIGKFIRWVVR